jgi:hypothetical protein
MGSKFGARRCSGLVDFGYMSFNVDKNGSMSWQSHVGFIRSQIARVSKL